MRNKLLKWGIALVVLAALAWPVCTYFKKAAITVKKPAPGQFFAAQSRDHIDIGAEHPAYNSNPPTGGWHYDTPSQTGIYDKEFPDEQLIHNLEHGHVWIAYKPDLPADQIEKLVAIAKSYGSKIIMAPRKANDAPIYFVAWEYSFSMDTVDEAPAREFIDAHRGFGPEQIPDSGFKDFRGTNEQPSGAKMVQ